MDTIKACVILCGLQVSLFFVSEQAVSFEPWSSGSKEIKLQKHRSNDRRLPLVHRQCFMQMTWPERGLMGDHGSMTGFITGRVMKAAPISVASVPVARRTRTMPQHVGSSYERLHWAPCLDACSRTKKELEDYAAIPAEAKDLLVAATIFDPMFKDLAWLPEAGQCWRGSR